MFLRLLFSVVLLLSSFASWFFFLADFVFRCRLDYSQVDAFLETLRGSLAAASCLLTRPPPHHLPCSSKSSLSIREERRDSVGGLLKSPSASPAYFSLENPLLWNLLVSHAPPFSFSSSLCKSSVTCHPSLTGDKECGRVWNGLEKDSHEKGRGREKEIVGKEDGKRLMKNEEEEWRQRRSDLSGVLQSTAQQFGIPCKCSWELERRYLSLTWVSCAVCSSG